MSTHRTDVAPSIKEGDLFTLEPLSFDANAANDKLDKCTTCVDCDYLCDILEEILDTLSNPDTPYTPERLRLVNLIQWTSLKYSRKSIRLQNQELEDYIRDIERLNRIPTAPAPASQPKRKKAKRQTTSTCKDVPSKKQAKSEQPLPPNTTSPPRIRGAESSMEEWETSADVSSEEVGTKEDDKPVTASSSSVAVAAPRSSTDNDGFTVVGHNGRRFAPIVIDSQRNATEFLDHLGKYCDTPLEGQSILH
ncbi:hypothetical protein TNCV_991581 [Trichonephila clavipes]|nr:hypothetical protein TNCV_991581 [Trichonephila clavipes]